MTNDPISDMLTRIRNASMVNKPEVLLPYSRVKHEIASILHKEGYVGKISKVESKSEHNPNSYAMLRIGLKYTDSKQSMFKQIKRVSKPGLRIYRKAEQLPVVLNNLGIAIVSTSKGMMTNKDARTAGIGGEIICEVY